jgi:GntR family transcriptional regulator
MRPGQQKDLDATLDRSNPVPLWAQLRDHLAARIDAAEFPSGLPSEHQLRAQYGVSRQTVRGALRHLRDEGVITARRGRRTDVVAGREIRQPLGALYSLFRSVEAHHQRQDSVVRVLDERADGVVASRLGLEESTPLFHLERLRLAEGTPLAVDRVWMPSARVSPLFSADFTHTAVYDELHRQCGIRITSGGEQINATIPTENECALLDIPDATAVFRIQRLGYAGGRPMEWRTTVVRGDRFSFSASWSPHDEYQLTVDLPAEWETAISP